MNADFAANLARDQVVVAGQHLDGDAVLPQRFDGFGRGVLGRVEKRQVAGQDKVAFVGLGERGLLAQFLGGHGQHAEAVLAQFIDLLHEVADQDRFHRENLALALKMRAFGEHRLRRALGQQLPFAVRAFDGHGHHAARKVERDFVHHLVFFDAEFAVQFLVMQHGAVEDVFQAGLEMADEVGVAQHRFALVFEHVAVQFEDDVVNGQRAGLVGAEHVHGAEVLDGIELLDDDLLFRHGQRALGQADGNNHRQHFRRQTRRRRPARTERRPCPNCVW